MAAITNNKKAKPLTIVVKDKKYTVQQVLLKTGEQALYFFNEQQLIVTSISAGIVEQRSLFNPQLLSPLDGLVVRLHVTVGMHVKKGEPLAVIEAMKMENILYAPHDAIIKTLSITQGDVVHQNQTVMIFEERGDKDARANSCHEQAEI